MFCCPLCHIKLCDIMEYEPTFLKKIKKRTKETIQINTHTKSTGDEKCPGCDLWVCDTEAEVKARGGSKFAIRVCRGDPDDPEIPRGKRSMTKTVVTADGRKVKMRLTWAQWHKSLEYGKALVWDLDPSFAIICTLHWDLQTTPLLIAGLVARNLDHRIFPPVFLGISLRTGYPGDKSQVYPRDSYT